jgi:Arc/MetJ-type ribon-helix-helix transcriptional regulator
LEVKVTTRVNLVLEDTVKASLDALIPSGQRSEFVNATLKSRLALLERQRAVAALEELRKQGPPVPAEEILQALRQDRERHQ